MYLFTKAAINTVPQSRWFKATETEPHTSGGQKIEIKVYSQNLAVLSSPCWQSLVFLGLQLQGSNLCLFGHVAIFLRVFTWSSLCLCLCVFSNRGDRHVGLRAHSTPRGHSMTSSSCYIFIIFANTLFPNKVTIIGAKNEDLGDTIQPTAIDFQNCFCII